MGLMTILSQKFELYRLEKRYTRSRDRRSTFVSEAQYVDGEYVYTVPSKAFGSTSSRRHNSNTSSLPSEDGGSGGEGEQRPRLTPAGQAAEASPGRKGLRVSVKEFKWDGIRP